MYLRSLVSLGKIRLTLLISLTIFTDGLFYDDSDF
jgi:hypothetical protein